MNEHTAPRPLLSATPLVALLPALLLLAYTLASPLPLWIGDVPDDALFYPVIARNLLAGHGFSFDGQSQTTGFHLPWLLLTTALGAAVGVERLFPAWIAMNGLLVLGAAWLWGRRHPEAALLSFMLSLNSMGAYGLGMETPLLLVALGLHFQARGPLAQGLSGFLVSICRIDYTIYLLASGRWGLLGGVVGVGATAGFNLLVGGQVASTSAAIKGMGDLLSRMIRLDPSTLLRYLPLAGGLGLILWLGLLAADAWMPERRLRPPAPELRLGLGALHLVLMVLGNNLVAPWYFVPFAWSALHAGLPLLQALPHPRLIRGLLVLVWLLKLCPLPGEGLHATVLSFATAVGTATEPDARILIEDFPGITAWFSGRQVIAADGVVGPASWKDALLNGEVLPAAAALGANHYAVSRRRGAFLSRQPPIDELSSPWVPAPPVPVPLRAEDRLFSVEDPRSHRLFALYRWSLNVR